MLSPSFLSKVHEKLFTLNLTPGGRKVTLHLTKFLLKLSFSHTTLFSFNLKPWQYVHHLSHLSEKSNILERNSACQSTVTLVCYFPATLFLILLSSVIRTYQNNNSSNYCYYYYDNDSNETRSQRLHGKLWCYFVNVVDHRLLKKQCLIINTQV